MQKKCKNFSGTFGVLLGVALFIFMAKPVSAGEIPVVQPETAKIQIVPGDGMNLVIKDELNPYTLSCSLTTPVHNWFAGIFTNLPTDKKVTISVLMNGNDTNGNKADVTKWAGNPGLIPVMTYADPMLYETYEWFNKDEQGRWVSGDPFKQGDASYAGTGTTPEQKVIPKEVAEEFLSKDGRYWQAWREVDEAEAIPGINVFRIRQKCAYSTATFAMRIPFTYTYLQQFIVKLQVAKLPGVFVDEIGTSPGGRKLQAIRVEKPDSDVAAEKQFTIVAFAREHATEADGSWALLGIFRQALQNRSTLYGWTLGAKMNWILIPIIDPDGSALSTFDALTDRFIKPSDPTTPHEVFDYARYFADYVTAGKTVDLAISLGNIEATEGPNLLCPHMEPASQTNATQINKMLFAQAAQEQFLTGKPDDPWGIGPLTFRLQGWCALHFRTSLLTFEVNSRYPANRLDEQRMIRLGEIIGRQVNIWCVTPNGADLHRNTIRAMARRDEARKAYYADIKHDPLARTKFELLTLGY